VKATKKVSIGGTIFEPGSSVQYKTGEWRTLRPMLDKSKCTKCALCWVYCPDMAITIGEDGFPICDLDYCKGCGICAEECSLKAITMVEEVER
jgi:pyruvate ferredoxin oxidoreductase delta subunit